MPKPNTIARLARTAAALIAAGCASMVGAAEPVPLAVVLTPQVQDGKVSRMDVELKLTAPNLGEGKTLVRAPIVLVGTPMAGYAGSAISARDDKGELPLKAEDEAATPTGKYRRWLAMRPTVGDVVVRYGTAPRQVDAQTRNGPLFDLRSEAGGVIGSGNYFYALPDTEDPYRVSMKWDLSKAPAGWRGVWSLGEGDVTTVVPANVLAFSYYVAGPVKSFPESRDTNFALYWLATPPFDVPALAAQTQRLYRYMAKFFDDAKAPYRVFFRGNPYPAGGGTALAKSFMFGYGVNGETASGGDVQMLLAHEMAHNWPRLDDDEHALTAWYTEGTAEYYSTVLALRSGAISLDKFLKLANDKANDYYTNVYRDLSNEEAGKKFWQDPRAQRVPYGRGFMYFVRLDAQLRQASAGRKSLDELVVAIVKQQRAGQKVKLADWEKMVVAELGEPGRKDFEAMAAGARIEMPANALGPCFQPTASTARPFELGFDDMRLGAVSNLREGSAAAQAGLKDGDKIVRMTPLAEVRKNDDALLELTLQRGDHEVKASYLPRGASVPSLQWVRKPGVPDSACRI